MVRLVDCLAQQAVVLGTVLVVHDPISVCMCVCVYVRVCVCTCVCACMHVGDVWVVQVENISDTFCKDSNCLSPAAVTCFKDLSSLLMTLAWSDISTSSSSLVCTLCWSNNCRLMTFSTYLSTNLRASSLGSCLILSFKSKEDFESSWIIWLSFGCLESMELFLKSRAASRISMCSFSSYNLVE